MMFPGLGGRLALAAMTFAWTATLVSLWTPPALYTLLFLGLAATTSIKFLRDHSQVADKDSYWWYNVSSSLCWSCGCFLHMKLISRRCGSSPATSAPSSGLFPSTKLC